MYTLAEYRGKGIATKILNELEGWATELSYKTCVLETGKRQQEAIGLLQRTATKAFQITDSTPEWKIVYVLRKS